MPNVLRQRPLVPTGFHKIDHETSLTATREQALHELGSERRRVAPQRARRRSGCAHHHSSFDGKKGTVCAFGANIGLALISLRSSRTFRPVSLLTFKDQAIRNPGKARRGFTGRHWYMRHSRIIQCKPTTHLQSPQTCARISARHRAPPTGAAQSLGSHTANVEASR